MNRQTLAQKSRHGMRHLSAVPTRPYQLGLQGTAPTTGLPVESNLPDHSSPFHARRRTASGSSTTTSENDRMTRVARCWTS
jgi:hypothetical protein